MAQRRDGWTNLVTGLGDALRDKRIAAQPAGVFLRQPQAEFIWRGSDMAARIIEEPVNDALRRGFTFQVKPNAGEEEERAQPDETAIDGRPPMEWPLLEPPEAEQRRMGAMLGARFDALGIKVSKEDLRSLAIVALTARARRRRDAAQHVTDPTAATEGQEDGNDAKEQQELVQARLKALGAKQAVRQAAKFERAYGGSAILLGTIDRSPGRSASMLARPLDLNTVEELRFLTVLSPMEVVPYRYYGDPLAPKYGEVAIWSVVPKSKGINPRGSVMRVHESRLVLFKGIRTSRFMVEAQRGFGDSILNRCVEHIRNFDTAFDSAAVLVHDFAQAVFKMKGLVELLQADNDKLIQKRAQAMEYVRSTVRAIVLDSEEDFERKQTPVTGLPDLLDRLAKRLAAAAGMPVTKMMGESPAGLNATGKADRDWYNENVDSMREDSLLPAIERITDVELHATNGATGGKVPDGWSIVFPPLEEPSEAELAEIRLKTAQADQIYINTGVLHPEEVAKSAFGGDQYSMERQLDADIRSAALEMQEEEQEKANDLHEQQLNQPPAGPPGKKPPFGG